MNHHEITTNVNPSRGWRRSVGVLLGLLLLPSIATAQRLPADMELQAFAPSSDYQLLVDGKPVAKAKLYFSQRAAAYLVTKAFETPVLLRQRGGSVESVNIMKLSRRDNGNIDLLQGAVYANLGRFRTEGEKILFTVDGQQATMVARPPLTGWHKMDELLEYTPEYGVKAGTYTPMAGPVASLRQQSKNVEVKVFFGSWCHVCKQFLPLGIKVNQSLGGSQVSFIYYGLPKPPKAWTDPVVKRANVKGVPTAIVYVDGKEAGRITNAGWRKPEQTLAQIVKDAS